MSERAGHAPPWQVLDVSLFAPAPGPHLALRAAATAELIDYVGTQAAKTSFATMIADMARGHPA